MTMQAADDLGTIFGQTLGSKGLGSVDFKYLCFAWDLVCLAFSWPSIFDTVIETLK